MAAKNTWTLPPMNMAGVSIFEEFDTITSGYYAATIVDSEDWTPKSSAVASSIHFRFKITEPGSENGKVASTWLGKNTEKEGIVRQWKGLLVSCGASPAALEANVQVQPQHFTGRTCYLHIITPPIAEGQKHKAEDISVRPISKDVYEEHKKANGAGASPAFATGAAPSLGFANGVAPGGAGAATTAFGFGGGGGGQQAAPAQGQPAQTVAPLPPANGAPAASVFEAPPAGATATAPVTAGSALFGA